MKPAQTYDKERIQVNIARLKKNGHDFEIHVDADKAVAFKEGSDVDIKEILKAEHIFTDVKKGELAPENEMKQLFGTDDAIEIARIIISEGEIQLTSEYRSKVREAKKLKVMELIRRNGVDPRTKAPIPMTRLENAFEEAKVKIQEFKTADAQVQEVIKQLRPVLPINFEIKEIELVVPGEFGAQVYGVVKNFGKIIQDNWLNNGSWQGVVEIPGGMEEDFFDQINKLTKGNVESKLIKTR